MKHTHREEMQDVRLPKPCSAVHRETLSMCSLFYPYLCPYLTTKLNQTTSEVINVKVWYTIIERALPR